MAEPAPLPPSETTASTADRVRSLIGVLLRYVAARGLLFQIEAREAGTHLAAIAVLLVLGLGALAGAWLLLVPAAVWYVAGQLHRPWEQVAAAAGGLHLFLALVFLLLLRGRLSRLKLFEESLNQFERDRSWVARNETQPK